MELQNVLKDLMSSKTDSSTDGKSPNRYGLIRICEGFVTNAPIKYEALPEVAAMRTASNAHIATEETPTLSAFLEEQSIDRQRRAAAQTMAFPASTFNYDKAVLLVLQSLVDGAIQKFEPVSLRWLILFLSHYSRLARHPTKTMDG